MTKFKVGDYVELGVGVNAAGAPKDTAGRIMEITPDPYPAALVSFIGWQNGHNGNDIGSVILSDELGWWIDLDNLSHSLKPIVTSVFDRLKQEASNELN